MSANAIAPVPNPIPPARASGERLAFVPKDFDDAWRQAEVLSKISIFPDYLKGKPHDILATIITGAELGLSPMQSVRDIVVVKGKGFIQSKLKVALIRQALNKPAGDYFRMISSSATESTWESKRDGHVTKYTYTMEMARLAGLDSNDNYKRRPAEMMIARCSGTLAEIDWSDVTRGIGNKEDLPDYGAIAINSAPATFAPPPPAQPEDAQVVPPTPPPPTPKQAFDQAKNELELKGTPPAEAPRERRLPIQDAPTPMREPGADEGEEMSAPVIPPASGRTDAPAESDLSLFAKLQAIDPADPAAESKIDAISPEAKRVQGPGRQQLIDLMKVKREAVKKARGGK